MLSRADMMMEGVFATARLFGEDYVRNNYHSKECEVFAEAKNGVSRYFVAFTSNKNKWDVFCSVSIDQETGKTKYLDYRLPSGLRMKNPIEKVRSA